MPPDELPSDLIPGVAVALAAGARRIVAPNAGLMTGPGNQHDLLGVWRIDRP